MKSKASITLNREEVKAKEEKRPFSVGQEYHVSFSITQEMVQTFSELTGDKSSLHVDPRFGRRSPYRTNVVHGFLPICWIFALPLTVRHEQMRIEKFSASFLKPIFSGHSFELSAKINQVLEAGKKVNFEFLVTEVSTNAILISGIFTLVFSTDIHFARKEPVQKCSSSLLPTPLTENVVTWKQISKQDHKEFDLIVTQEAARMLYEILTEGNSKNHLPDFSNWTRKWQLTNFLASLTFSTFAGMGIPGRFATVMNVQIDFAGPLSWNEIYTLSGEVVFKSSAESIVENLSIREKEGSKIALNGKMNVKVGKEPPKMPSIQDLKDEISDLGLQDKVVMVTGASRGIGETTAKLFARHGSKVVVNYLSGEEDAERIVKEIEGAGAQAMAVRADVSDEKEVQSMIKAVEERFGDIDILVNNAVRNAIPIEFENLSWEEIQKDIDVTVKGAFNCSKAVLAGMVRKGGGKIVNVSTVYVDSPPLHQLKYVVSKSGLVGLARSLAVEFSSRNIQVNLVIPTMVETDLSSGVSPFALQAIVQKSPAKRLVTPIEVARAILLLSSSSRSAVTGQEVMVTGVNEPPSL